MFERKVYKDTIVLDKSQYAKVLEIAENGKNANNVAEFIKSNRTVEKDIWNNLFVPYIENPSNSSRRYIILQRIEIMLHIARFCPGVLIRSYWVILIKWMVLFVRQMLNLKAK